MILAGNKIKSKQREPPHIYLENQDGGSQRQSFLVKYVLFCMIVTYICTCITCNFSPW